MWVPWCSDTGMALSGATLELYSTREVSYLGRFVSWTATVQKPTYTHTYYLVAGTLLILAQTPVDPRRRLALPRRFSNMTSFGLPQTPYRNGASVHRPFLPSFRTGTIASAANSRLTPSLRVHRLSLSLSLRPSLLSSRSRFSPWPHRPSIFTRARQIAQRLFPPSFPILQSLNLWMFSTRSSSRFRLRSIEINISESPKAMIEVYIDRSIDRSVWSIIDYHTVNVIKGFHLSESLKSHSSLIVATFVDTHRIMNSRHAYCQTVGKQHEILNRFWKREILYLLM